MAQAYFPRGALEAILPEQLAIPDDETMAKYYPETELHANTHPFMLSFSHGSDIHDAYTNMNVPEQEEIMFVFPVIYTNDNGAMHLSSYVPVLYLDSFLGMIGGLYFGLRKQYHPRMKYSGDATGGKWWSIEGIIEASFDSQADRDMEKLPLFYEQTFSNPFVTVSYPLPLSKMVFYQARVFPSIVRGASEVFRWNYKGETVTNSDRGSSVFAEYAFTMSHPVSSKQYFGGRQV
jgi:hypothetical protein